MSQDASTILGWGYYDNVHQMIIWSEANGLCGLHELLERDLGPNLEGWILDEVGDISADETVIVGIGTNCYGYEEGVAVILEPSTAILLAFGLFAFPWSRTAVTT